MLAVRGERETARRGETVGTDIARSQLAADKRELKGEDDEKRGGRRRSRMRRCTGESET